MGRDPVATGRPAVPGDDVDQPTQRLERVRDGSDPGTDSSTRGWAVAPPTYRLPDLPARPGPGAVPPDPQAPPAEPAPLLFGAPGGPAGLAFGAPGGAGGYGPPRPYRSADGRLDDSTGTFTRVLLTGLGGEADHPAAAVPAPPHPRPQPSTAGGRVLGAGRDRTVATTRRLGARLAALRGDERTAMLAVGAVVGVVLLALAILVVVVRFTGDRAEPAASRPGAPAVATPTQSAGPTPTESPLPPTGGSFAARHSGFCLGAPAARTDSGAQLVQRACGVEGAAGFQLVAQADRADAYALVDAGTSLCADVYGASVADGAPVVQWDCNGGPNQTFELRALPDSGGYVQIIAAHSGKCLDVTGISRDEGAPIQQYGCRTPEAEADAAAGNQSWRFSPG